MILRKAAYLSLHDAYNYFRGVLKLRISGSYPEFETALAQCSPLTWSSEKYWDSQLHKVRREQAKIEEPMKLPSLYLRGMLAGLPSGAKILDYGGGLGQLYVSGRFYEFSFEWHVQDCPEAIAYAHNNKLETESLSFVQYEQGPYDAILISGTLQYLDEPFTLLSKFESELIVINNIPLVDVERSYVAIQKSPFGAHPIWIFSRPEFEKFLQTHYAHVIELENSDGLLLGVKPVGNVSYICRK